MLRSKAAKMPPWTTVPALVRPIDEPGCAEPHWRHAKWPC